LKFLEKKMRKFSKSLLLLITALTSVLAGDDDIFCTGVEDRTLVRDPSACYRYFVCVEGSAVLQYCREGQYFDFFLQGCDDIDRVYCADGGGTVFPTPETTQASDVDHSMCDEVPNYQYLPSSEACNRYYQCMNGQAFPFLCPVGQFFDEPRQTCDLEDNVDCNPTTETTTAPTTTGPTAPTPGENLVIKKPLNHRTPVIFRPNRNPTCGHLRRRSELHVCTVPQLLLPLRTVRQ
jgi:Chitin binding Peritrophin-A domain